MPIHKYRPANGTERMGFYENWCARCRHDRPEDADGGCEILRRTFIHEVTDPEYPDEWTCDDRGRTTCMTFEPLEHE